MCSRFQGDSTARNFAEDLLDALRRCCHALLQNHVTSLIQNTVMACSVSQIYANRKLLRFENLVRVFYYSDILLHSRSPFLVLRARRLLGAYRIPMETGLLIPSDKSRNRTLGISA